MDLGKVSFIVGEQGTFILSGKDELTYVVKTYILCFLGCKNVNVSCSKRICKSRLNMFIEIKSKPTHSVFPRRIFPGYHFFFVFLKLSIDCLSVVEVESEGIKDLCQIEMGEFPLYFLRAQPH